MPFIVFVVDEFLEFISETKDKTELRLLVDALSKFYNVLDTQRYTLFLVHTILQQNRC